MAENQEQKQKINLQDIVNYAKISAGTDNPIYANYSLDDYLDSKSDIEKRELEAWIIPLKQEIMVTKSIPDWGKRALNNYQKLYSDSLSESKVSTLIELAKKIGYEPEDFSNLVKPGEVYNNITESKAAKELMKKISNAKIDGEEPKLTEEEQILGNQLNAITTVEEMIRKTITNSYDKRHSNDSLKQLNEKYKPKEEKKAA